MKFKMHTQTQRYSIAFIIMGGKQRNEKKKLKIGLESSWGESRFSSSVIEQTTRTSKHLTRVGLEYDLTAWQFL